MHLSLIFGLWGGGGGWDITGAVSTGSGKQWLCNPASLVWRANSFLGEVINYWVGSQSLQLGQWNNGCEIPSHQCSVQCWLFYGRSYHTDTKLPFSLQLGQLADLALVAQRWSWFPAFLEFYWKLTPGNDVTGSYKHSSGTSGKWNRVRQSSLLFQFKIWAS